MSDKSGHIGKTEGEYNVVQFFSDKLPEGTGGTHEYVRRRVAMGEALMAFKHYTENVAARIGVVDRVIITDGGDSTALEWRADKGYTTDGSAWHSHGVFRPTDGDIKLWNGKEAEDPE